jgi:hypothetical protein
MKSMGKDSTFRMLEATFENPRTLVMRLHVSEPMAGLVCVRRLHRPPKFSVVGSGALSALSGHAPQPVGDSSSDLVGGVFLNEMDSLYRLFGERRPPANKVDQPVAGEDRTRLSLEE